MDFFIKNCKITISPLFAAFVCIVLLIDKTGIMLFGLVSVLIHEIGHLFFMILLKKYPENVNLQLGGILIKSKGFSSYKNEFLIAMGGCLFNFLTFLICLVTYSFNKSEIFVIFAASNISLMLFNLAPISGLDGMDLIRLNLVQKHSLKTTEILCFLISFLFLITLLFFSIIGIIKYKLNPSILVCLIYLLILTLLNIKKQG